MTMSARTAPPLKTRRINPPSPVCRPAVREGTLAGGVAEGGGLYMESSSGIRRRRALVLEIASLCGDRNLVERRPLSAAELSREAGGRSGGRSTRFIVEPSDSLESGRGGSHCRESW